MEPCWSGSRGDLDSFKSLHTGDSMWLEDEGHIEDDQEVTLERWVGDYSWRTWWAMWRRWRSQITQHPRILLDIDLRMVPLPVPLGHGQLCWTAICSLSHLFLLGFVLLGIFCFLVALIELSITLQMIGIKLLLPCLTPERLQFASLIIYHLAL